MRTIPRRPWPTMLCLTSLWACGAPEADSGGAKATWDRRLEIEAPLDGALLDAGAPTELVAEGRDDDAAIIELEHPLWHIIDEEGATIWQAPGNPLTVSDLPAGTWTLRCAAGVDGYQLEDSVEVNVFAKR
jgi:hypothetical protein